MSQATCTVYSAPSQAEKLSRLRAKTDRQLMDIIHAGLKKAADLAAIAQTKFAEGDAAAAQHAIGRADRILNEAQTLLVLIPEHQRRAIEWKIDQVTMAVACACRNGELVRPLFFTARARICA